MLQYFYLEWEKSRKVEVNGAVKKIAEKLGLTVTEVTKACKRAKTAQVGGGRRTALCLCRCVCV